MQTEKEIIASILHFIKPDQNIKVAILNGSRANPNAPKDFMQDYDIALYVESLDEAEKYKNNQNWQSKFGELVIVQQNNFDDNAFIFLLQYADSLRIDLSFHDLKTLQTKLKNDSLSIVLYDVKQLVGDISKSNESTYFVQKPTRQEWDATLNDIWWLQICVAKELWRNEIPLAKKLYDVYIMNQLKTLVTWTIANQKDWLVNTGNGGKWLKDMLPEALYNEYLSFYSSANIDEQWDKLLHIGPFIQQIAIPLSVKLGYDYPLVYDENVSHYIQRISTLRKGAAHL